MKKKARSLMTATLAAALAAGLALLPVHALAKNDHAQGASKQEGSSTEKQGKTDSASEADVEKKRGLHRAIEQVKDTPAEETISILLSSKYEVDEIIESLDELSESGESADLTGEPAAEADVEAVADAIRKGHKEGKYKVTYEGLTQLADVFDQLDKPAEAIDTQEEAIAENPADLEGYKKLGKLKKKAGKAGLQAFVNGEAVVSDVEPFFIKGRAMVPFRAIAASLKATVEYKEDGTVTVTKDGVVIELKAGSTTALVDGKEYTLSAAPIVKHNRVFVPFRFIAEAFAMKVGYEPESGSVIVNDPAESTDDGSAPEDAAAPADTVTPDSTGTPTDMTPAEPTQSPAS
ncbi:copper amine oxidase N-terminal domain-containing protein [Cohnella kolymensis]|uniref:copper amine oxidase N-terminal domain-containing protein n=1 Tax=Cohnella kolymensis TaxID=1590652 RepID=UPI000695CCD8|nr:copper amine oxidase N-terminal domain-containing protein [Cohnella kolymensis]